MPEPAWPPPSPGTGPPPARCSSRPTPSAGTTATDAGTVDAAASPDGQYLYVRAGAEGIVDEFRVNPGGSLTAIGSVTVPNAVGGEGIAVS